jgi:hypothetical protein
MKKGARCPVCGSVHIEKKPAAKPAGAEPPTDKAQTDGAANPNWKCFDCYRNFEKPDETG